MEMKSVAHSNEAASNRMREFQHVHRDMSMEHGCPRTQQGPATGSEYSPCKPIWTLIRKVIKKLTLRLRGNVPISYSGDPEINDRGESR